MGPPAGAGAAARDAAALLRRLNDDVMAALTAASVHRERAAEAAARAHWQAVQAALLPLVPPQPLPAVTVRLSLELRAHAIARTLADWEGEGLCDWLARELEEHLRRLWLAELDELERAEAQQHGQ